MTRSPERTAVVVQAMAMAIALALSSCGDGGGGGPVAVSPTPTPSPTPTASPSPTPSPTARPASVERSIAPNTVDATLSASDPANIVINPDPAVVPRERLFVMLPGTGAAPRNYREIVRTGATRGYHAIGLAYPNETAVAELCGVNGDVNCSGNARREIVTGNDTSTLVSINNANSIAGRLARLLTYLNATFPAEGWGRYLANGTVDWSLVTVAGHSQGAGHAGYMAKLFNLDRVAMFSGPADATSGNPAAWLSQANVTPAARQYGFTHVNDELVPYAMVRNHWALIGLGAPASGPVSVDGASPPYGDSRQLSTNAAPETASGSRHGATVVDIATPRNAQGSAIFAPVWIYMAFP